MSKSKNIKSLIGKKVKVHSIEGLMRSGVLKSISFEKEVIVLSNKRGKTEKLKVFNWENVYSIEEE